MNEKTPETVKEKPTGGLYAKVKMSVRTANILVLILLAALIVATLFLVKNNGFTVSFDTDGGSSVESVRVLHSEKISLEEDPVKEGYVFTGWYIDKACTVKWNPEKDVVTGSMTLYAGWKEK